MNENPYQCRSCGEWFEPPLDRCPVCGGRSWNTTVTVNRIDLDMQVWQSGVVADSHYEDSESIQYSSPEGLCSTSKIGPDGVSVELAGVAGLARDGEWRVAELLASLLVGEGHSVVIKQGNDAAGEDKIFEIDERRVIVQCVTAPTASELYQSASVVPTTMSVDLEAARAWVAQSIKEKANRYGSDMKSTTILAVDVRHVGVLASQRAIDRSVKAVAATSGVFGVCLIGPYSSRVTWLAHPSFLGPSSEAAKQ